MGQKQSKKRNEQPSSSATLTEPRPLYPNLANEFPGPGHENAVDLLKPYEAHYGNPPPFHNVQSHYYNPVPSAPPAPEILVPEIPATAQRTIIQKDRIQTRQPDNWRANRERHDTKLDKKPCPNASDGCKLHFTAEQLKSHVKECLFMDVTCPLDGVFGTCPWRDKIKHIKTHFSDVHPLHIGAVDQMMTLINPRIIHLIDLNPHKFLVHIKVDQDDRKILLAVQHYSTQFSAGKWTYEFEFHGPLMARSADTKLEGICTTAATSIVKKFNSLQCRVLTMTPCVMNAFRNGLLKYKYRIKGRDNSGLPKEIEGDSTDSTRHLKRPSRKRSKKQTKARLECA